MISGKLINPVAVKKIAQRKVYAMRNRGETKKW
jgi:hypothetical protein